MKVLDLKNPFNAPVYHEKNVSSTFDTARLLAQKNKPSGTVICADYQESGRGRFKRSWVSECGKNLLFTILLRYDGYSSVPQALTLKVGLAVSLALEDLIPSLAGFVKVKWPNDIMIDKTEAAGKVAGILCETDGEIVYIGVGINLAQKEFPGECLTKAISIVQICPELNEDTRFLLLEKILMRLYNELKEPRQYGLANWHELLSERLYKKGENVIFAESSTENAADNTAETERLTEGKLSGLGPGGELFIIPKGEEKEISFVSGELRVYNKVLITRCL